MVHYINPSKRNIPGVPHGSWCGYKSAKRITTHNYGEDSITYLNCMVDCGNTINNIVTFYHLEHGKYEATAVQYAGNFTINYGEFE